MGKVPSHSTRAVFKACKRKAMFEGELRLEPKVQGAGRRMGKAFAKALELGVPGVVDELYGIVRGFTATGVVGMENAPQESVNDVLLEAGKVRLLAAGYLDHYRHHDTAPGRTLTPEVRFDSDVVGTGFLDAVIEDSAGGRIGIETKLLSKGFWRGSDEKRLGLDDQITAYHFGMREAGTPLDKLLYRVIFKPGIDRRTKRQPETVDEYLTRLADDIAAEPAKYFVQYDLYRSDDQLDEFAAEVDDVRREYERAKKRGAWPRSTERCSDYGGCGFLDLCRGVPGAMDALRVKPIRLRGQALQALQALQLSMAGDEGTPTGDIAKMVGRPTDATGYQLRKLAKDDLVVRVQPAKGSRVLWAVAPAGVEALAAS